jgi:hypothetical protein
MDFLRFSSLALVLSAASVACVPDLDSDDSTVSVPVVLAVQAEPAEAGEGRPVTYRTLFVSSDGQTPRGSLTWFHCKARKPAAELGPVSQDCFDESTGMLASIGKGLEVTGIMPIDACSLFGPKPPLQGINNGPPGRPADPDVTGGYKQPVVIGVIPDQGTPNNVLYEQRIHCGLSGVDPQTSGEYNQRYRDNVNPRIESFEVKRASGEQLSAVEDAALDVNAGETVELVARWQACPEVDVCGDGICSIHELADSCTDDCTTPKGCAGQEDYLWLDVQSGKLVDRRESMSVAWYGTQGAYVDERTGVEESERADRSANEWTAPAQPGPVTLWTVVRDSRGGVGFQALRVNVH